MTRGQFLLFFCAFLLSLYYIFYESSFAFSPSGDNVVSDVVYRDFSNNSSSDDWPDYDEFLPKTFMKDNAELSTTFNSSGTDTFVFLHMQKTGGTTLGIRLVKDIVHLKCEKVPGRKRSQCRRPDIQSDAALPSTWIFSRYSTGWVCGLHADWTELRDCVAGKLNVLNGKRNRNLIYITSIRNATLRFISEWKHVQRGATWRTSTLTCGNKENTDLWDRCFPDRNDWMDVTLEEFTSCPHNLAFNRQTRMLADLDLVNCYENLSNFHNVSSDIERIMLDSAKHNLSTMRWFGLVEFQQASEILFEHVFQPLHFDPPFQKYNSTHSSEAIENIPEDLLQKITQLNHLDAALYEFARDLFFQRYQNVQIN